MTPTATIPRDSLDQFAVTITLHKDVESSGGGQALVEFAMRYAFYGALTAIFLMVMALVVKLMWNCDEDEITSGEARRATENSSLLLSKDDTIKTYGTSEEDLERSSSTSSSEDLYDGKICVICYDDQRNCFFIPCGHCVTCHTCAYRIINEESKSCPICRGIIDKVRKLHIL